MRIESLTESLRDALNADPSTDYERAVGALQEVATAIGVATGQGVKVSLERGWATNLGDGYRVTAEQVGGAVTTTLFRAYVPPAGFPVSLDFAEEDPVSAPDQESLVDLTAGFLQRPSVVATLRTMRS